MPALKEKNGNRLMGSSRKIQGRPLEETIENPETCVRGLMQRILPGDKVESLILNKLQNGTIFTLAKRLQTLRRVLGKKLFASVIKANGISEKLASSEEGDKLGSRLERLREIMGNITFERTVKKPGFVRAVADMNDKAFMDLVTDERAERETREKIFEILHGLSEKLDVKKLMLSYFIGKEYCDGETILRRAEEIKERGVSEINDFDWIKKISWQNLFRGEEECKILFNQIEDCLRIQRRYNKARNTIMRLTMGDSASRIFEVCNKKMKTLVALESVAERLQWMETELGKEKAMEAGRNFEILFGKDGCRFSRWVEKQKNRNGKELEKEAEEGKPEVNEEKTKQKFVPINKVLEELRKEGIEFEDRGNGFVGKYVRLCDPGVVLRIYGDMINENDREILELYVKLNWIKSNADTAVAVAGFLKLNPEDTISYRVRLWMIRHYLVNRISVKSSAFTALEKGEFKKLMNKGVPEGYSSDSV